MSFRILSWFLIGFGCFYGIGSTPLLDNNEGMYASIARDMLTNGNFIIPHAAGLPYIEKPPMLYWLMALSMSLFGQNEFAVHLVPALAYFFTAFGLYRFTNRATNSETTGLATAIIFVTSLPMLVWGRQVLCDMIMTCFFSNAMWCMYGWQQDQKKKRLFAFYAFLAFATLTKGLIAILLAGGIFTVFYLWERKLLPHYFKIISPLGVGLFLLIAAPWHILASMQEPGFAWFYFINEHLLRFTNQRLPHDYHTGSWWYYLPRILIYLIPWTLFLFIFILKLKPSSSTELSLARFLWSWFFVCLIFFSLAGSKANYYMLIGMPPLVLLMILHLKHYIDTDRRIARSLVTGGLSLTFLMIWFSNHFCTENSGDFFDTCQAISWNYIPMVGIACIVAIVLAWRIPQRWLFPLLGSHIFLLLPLLIASVNTAGDRMSQKNIALYLQDYANKDVAIYQEFEDVSALAFYLHKQLWIVDSHSTDLQYGQKKLVQNHAESSMFLSLHEWSQHTHNMPMVVLNKRLDSVIQTLYTFPDSKPVCVAKRFGLVSILSACNP